MKKNVLVTGSKGQLGSEIQRIISLCPQLSFIFTDIDELDISNQEDVSNFFKLHKIDYVINCAAYTAVDYAEIEIDTCYKINEIAVGNLARVASKHNAKFIHISTDYVFNGRSYIPYTEEMDVYPKSVYGKSKLAGERLLTSLLPDSVIIRTSWLYSSYGNNFVKTMLRLGKERDEINIVFDQIGTPTYAADLAYAILKIVCSNNFISGIYHYSNEGVCSWYDFAICIFQSKNINCKVIPIESKDYPAKTPRPHYSVLNKRKIKETYKLNIPHWEDGLRRCLAIL
ncbi:MAG: dTDP-4-dehydrorhamnose reductase [Bacteroidales bacterium 36-12]|nr:MAG: dTDP-4-dehydrorhamnose reductase [Bacteroidales bacterium 36-12]